MSFRFFSAIVLTAGVVVFNTLYLPHHTAADATVPAQARTGANNYGIAAGGGLTSETPAELSQRLDTMQDLGVGWVRFDFDWNIIQPTNATTYNWTSTDRVVQAATAHHLKVLGIIDNAPVWARTSGCTTKRCQPADPVAFGRFSGAVAAHYTPMGVHDWEIWNEENSLKFWQPEPNTSAYTQILETSYAAIKKSDPTSFVLAGGLGEANFWSSDISATTFVSQLYADGASASFDGIASHPYSFPGLPSVNDSQGPYALHQIMINHRDGLKPIWVTEIGAPTNGPSNTRVTKAFQAKTVIVAARLYNQPWLGPLFWYSDTDNGTVLTTKENFFGLVTVNNIPKPAYTTFKDIISGNR